MTIISGLGPLPGIRAGGARTAASGFAVPQRAAFATPGVQVTAMPGLLALQEVGQEAGQAAGQAAVQDREARRHGAAMVAALSELQRALLGGGDPDALDRLAALVRRAPPPADPALAQVQRAVLVRAAVEIARRAAALR